jgi:hypothetical protein
MIGKIVHQPLRDVWKLEALDFKDAIIDAMVRLEAAIRPFIQSIE